VSYKNLVNSLYYDAIGAVDTFEQAWIKGIFETYREADDVNQLIFLPEEQRFSGPTVRRGMLEKRFAEEIPILGGERLPDYTVRKSDGCQTSHFSRYRLKGLDFTVSAVPDDTSIPRFAEFRQDRFRAVQGMLSFMNEPAPQENAQLNVLFKHGQDKIESSIPQFAVFEVFDADYVSIWKRDLLMEQVAFVEDLLTARAEAVPDDEGIPKLRARLRRRRFGS
jgi:hypothetical protein